MSTISERRYDRVNGIIDDIITEFLPDEPTLDDWKRYAIIVHAAWNTWVGEASKLTNIKAYSADVAKHLKILPGDMKKLAQVLKYVRKEYPVPHFTVQEIKIEVVNDHQLKLIVQPDFLFDEEEEDGWEEEVREDVDEMELLNRMAVLVRPLPAFWAWCKQQVKGFEVPDKNKQLEFTSYLVSFAAAEMTAEERVQANYQLYFNDHVIRWLKDYGDSNQLLPVEQRSYELFQQFFETEFSHLIWDTSSTPLEVY